MAGRQGQRGGSNPRRWERDDAFDLVHLLHRLPEVQPDAVQNAELAELYLADQQDRESGWGADGMAQRDGERRGRVLAVVTEGGSWAAADFFHAAMIFQHGSRVEHYHLAHELARLAAQARHPRARWLSAATIDRWLMASGLPQRYGTQFVEVDGELRLHPVDPLTTDEDRARLDVPPLAEQEQFAARWTREGD